MQLIADIMIANLNNLLVSETDISLSAGTTPTPDQWMTCLLYYMRESIGHNLSHTNVNCGLPLALNTVLLSVWLCCNSVCAQVVLCSQTRIYIRNIIVI